MGLPAYQSELEVVQCRVEEIEDPLLQLYHKINCHIQILRKFEDMIPEHKRSKSEAFLFIQEKLINLENMQYVVKSKIRQQKKFPPLRAVLPNE